MLASIALAIVAAASGVALPAVIEAGNARVTMTTASGVVLTAAMFAIKLMMPCIAAVISGVRLVDWMAANRARTIVAPASGVRLDAAIVVRSSLAMTAAASGVML